MISTKYRKPIFKVEIARQLLLNYSLSISEVAYKTGFNDPKYFSKCFKNKMGFTPREYREAMKKLSIGNNNQSSDAFFLEAVITKLDMKIYDLNLSIDQFATEMNVSKASLYRKLKSTVGLSPCEFIRSIRIERSAQLLKKQKNISDIAFSVGFNDPKYFSRCFKIEYGVTPREFQLLSRTE